MFSASFHLWFPCFVAANRHHFTMACFNPSYTMPGAISNVGLGFSCRTGPNVSGWGGYGYSGFGGAIGGRPSGMLGLTSGANFSRTSQLPPSEIVIQPPTCVLTIPEPVVSAVMPPVILSSSSPCSYGSSGYGYGSGSVGGCPRGGMMGGFQSIGPPRGRCNIYRCPC